MRPSQIKKQRPAFSPPHANECELIMWDWKEQPPVAELNKALASVLQPSLPPQVYEVGDTGCDQFAWIVGPQGLSQEQVQRIFNHFTNPEA